MQELFDPPTAPVIDAHYATEAIQFEMAKACAHRECSALRPQGMLKPFKMFRAKDVAFWMDRLHVAQTPTDLYMSVLRVDLPVLPSDIQGMRRMQDLLLREWNDRVKGYSWFLDIDVVEPRRDFQAGKDAAIRCTEVARDMGLAAYPVFSGTGWNVRLDDYEYLGPVDLAPAAMRELAKQVAEQAGVPWSNKKEANKTGIPLWVDNSVYDIRRIYRIPFTINTKSGLVTTPMTLGEARECDLSWFAPTDYAQRWDVRNRLQRVNDEAAKGRKVVA